MATLFCTECGTENQEGVQFCENCGHKLVSIELPAEEVETAEVFISTEISGKIAETPANKPVKSPGNMQGKPVQLLAAGMALLLAGLAVVFVFRNKKLPGISGPKPEREMYLFRISGTALAGEHMLPDMVETWFKEVKHASEVTRYKGARAGDLVIQAKVTDTEGVETEQKVLIRNSGTWGGKKHMEMDSAEMWATLADDESTDSVSDNRIFLGLSPVVCWVNTQNNRRTITPEELAAMLSGESLDSSTRCMVPDSNTWLGKTWIAEFMEKAGKSVANRVLRSPSYDSMIQWLESNPGGIAIGGYIPSATHVTTLALDLNGQAVRPGQLTISMGEYPFSQPMYLKAGKKSSEPMKSFMDFCQNRIRQKSVVYGFAGPDFMVTTSSRSRNLNDSLPEAVRDYWKELALMGKVMNVKIEFDADGTALAPGMDILLRRVSDFLSRPEFGTKEILVVGFSAPTDGMDKLSLQASENRAKEVEQLLTANGLKVRTLGLAGSFPIGWAGDKQFVARNRRAEIWLQ
ncbi:MAG: zinc-ribbon domain-containing protein [Bacteroidia bacterium]|nr:zinc-ribbon domain-containing protein [Bacteroidia bacterium]